MQPNKECIFCRTKENLNTDMTITIDGGLKVQVMICDEHAEDATVKTAREAFGVWYEHKKEEQKKAEAMLAELKAMGINVTVQQGSGLVIPDSAPMRAVQTTATHHPDPASGQPPILVQQAPVLKGDDVIPTAKLDSFNMVSVGGSAGGYNVSSHSAHRPGDLQDKLDPKVLNGHAKMVAVEGREGQVFGIPAIRTDGTGTTRIIMDKRGNDAALQRRFKNMANQERVMNFAREGYQNTMRTCPLCAGKCTIGKENEMCTKCSGVGSISVY